MTEPLSKTQFNIFSPVFKRQDGIVIEPSKEMLDFDKLKNTDSKTLIDMGYRLWDEETNLWLIPHEQYNSIPAGQKLIDISGEEFNFKPGETDNDIRYGMLACGFIKESAT